MWGGDTNPLGSHTSQPRVLFSTHSGFPFLGLRNVVLAIARIGGSRWDGTPIESQDGKIGQSSLSLRGAVELSEGPRRPFDSYLHPLEPFRVVHLGSTDFANSFHQAWATRAS